MRNSRHIICLLVVALFVALPFASVFAQDMDVMDPATFGLDADKPYDGTQLKFLICCSTAPQFASAAVKGAAEFTAMTGISVSWGRSALRFIPGTTLPGSDQPQYRIRHCRLCRCLGHQYLRLLAPP